MWLDGSCCAQTPPQFSRVQPTPAREIGLTVSGQSGAYYQIDAATNLASWNALATLASGTLSSLHTPIRPRRFFRAVFTGCNNSPRPTCWWATIWPRLTGTSDPAVHSRFVCPGLAGQGHLCGSHQLGWLCRRAQGRHRSRLRTHIAITLIPPPLTPSEPPMGYDCIAGCLQLIAAGAENQRASPGDMALRRICWAWTFRPWPLTKLAPSTT